MTSSWLLSISPRSIWSHSIGRSKVLPNSMSSRPASSSSGFSGVYRSRKLPTRSRSPPPRSNATGPSPRRGCCVSSVPFDWARLNDIFHRALEVPADARAAFLDQACGGDAQLRQEVASLLDAHERAGNFIEHPSLSAADLLSKAIDAGESLVGKSVGQYRIRRVLGEGGMGIVYLADDTRLGRPVALKALAPHFTRDADRRERLTREARAAAALTHPGIATVYALEEFDDHLYICSEYVPGEALRAELKYGPQP